MRHELKFTVTPSEAERIRKRLLAVAKPDTHAQNGKYLIRSLYFDTPQNDALLEKINGVNKRSKYRLRMYNGDDTLIHLEKKSKLNGLCSKQSTVISKQETQQILAGCLEWRADTDRPLANELALAMRSRRLQPKTIVDYTREPFVYPAGNVRVTLDSNIKTALRCTDFLDASCVTVSVPDDPIILEVKWDAYLPDIIRAAVQLDRLQGAYSKYAACRAYG